MYWNKPPEQKGVNLEGLAGLRHKSWLGPVVYRQKVTDTRFWVYELATERSSFKLTRSPCRSGDFRNVSLYKRMSKAPLRGPQFQFVSYTCCSVVTNTGIYAVALLELCPMRVLWGLARQVRVMIRTWCIWSMSKVTYLTYIYVPQRWHT